MSEIILSTVKSWDGLAEAFAEEIAKQYKMHLEFWHASAMDDKAEQAMWEKRIKEEPDLVKTAAFNHIKSIMGSPQYNRRYYQKKYKIFVNWSMIQITNKSGFYRNLLPGKDITQTFPVNVEYRIDMTQMSVIKVVHPQTMEK